MTSRYGNHEAEDQGEHRSDGQSERTQLSPQIFVACPSHSVTLVELELLHPGFVSCHTGLILLVENETLHCQMAHLGMHKASVRVCGRAYDWLAADVERCVQQHGVSRERLESAEQLVQRGISLAKDCLDVRGVIDVCHRGKGSPRDLEFLEAGEPFLLWRDTVRRFSRTPATNII